MRDIELYATKLNNGEYAVKPLGQLGTCGFYPIPWEVVYVKACNEEDAISKVRDDYA